MSIETVLTIVLLCNRLDNRGSAVLKYLKDHSRRRCPDNIPNLYYYYDGTNIRVHC